MYATTNSKFYSKPSQSGVRHLIHSYVRCVIRLYCVDLSCVLSGTISPIQHRIGYFHSAQYDWTGCTVCDCETNRGRQKNCGSTRLLLGYNHRWPTDDHPIFITAARDEKFGCWGISTMVLYLSAHMGISFCRGILQGTERFYALWSAQALEHLVRIGLLIALMQGVVSIGAVWVVVVSAAFAHVVYGAWLLPKSIWKDIWYQSSPQKDLTKEIFAVVMYNFF